MANEATPAAVARARSLRWWVCLLPLALVFAGCRGPAGGRPQAEVAFPLWMTKPSADEQADALVNLGLALPPHLQPLADKYALPGWVVYGVVRCLGAEEARVNGTVKRFSVRDEAGEDTVVVDKIHYDVPMTAIDAVLRQLAADCARAETEMDRQNVLGRYVRRRFGGILLFSLRHQRPIAPGAEGKNDNLLFSSGVTRDEMQPFRFDPAAALPQVGWKETPSSYRTTMIGQFSYGDPVGAFRRVEEDAIYDLAQGMLLKFSHMQKRYDDDAAAGDDAQEDTTEESVNLRMRGIAVVSRAVDLGRGLCVVVAEVPRSGVARK